MKKINSILIISIFLIVSCKSKTDEKSAENTPNREINSCALDIPTVGQKSGLWCWAASAEMMINYYRTATNKITQIQIVETVLDIKLSSLEKPCDYICPSDSINSCTTNVNYDCAPTLADSNEIIKLLNSLNHEFIYKKYLKLTWGEIKSSIDSNKPISITLKYGSQSFGEYRTTFKKYLHNVVVVGYLESNGLNLMLIKDPWKPCQGNEYLLAFDSEILDYSLCYSIYPKLPSPNLTLKKPLPNSTIFSESIEFINRIFSLKFNENPNPKKTSSNANGVECTLKTIPVTSSLNEDYVQKKIQSPDSLIIFDNNNFSNTAIITKESNNKWVIRQVQAFPKYALLCCFNSNVEYVCRLSYEKQTKKSDTSQGRTFVVSPDPSIFILNPTFGTVSKYYEAFTKNNIMYEPQVLSVQNLVINNFVKIDNEKALKFDFFKKTYEIETKKHDNAIIDFIKSDPNYHPRGPINRPPPPPKGTLEN